MTPVDMRRFAVRCPCCLGKTEHGDCASAVLASLLDLPIEAVPVFVEAGTGWWFYMEEWLAARGLQIRTVGRADLPEGYAYASGESARGFHHAVVWTGGPRGRIAHDPHPSRAGLVGDPTVFHVLEPTPYRCPRCPRGLQIPPAVPPGASG